MKKRILSLFLCLVMIMSLPIIGLQIINAAPDTVYSLATDNDIQGKEAGATFEGTTWLERVGSPTLTVVDNGGVKGISVTNRGSDWHCIDLKNLASLPDGFKYTVKVTGSTVSGAKMKLAQPSSPYGTHASHVVGEDGTFSLEKAFTYEQLQADKKIRIQSEGTTGDFFIDSIEIIKVSTAPPPDTVYSLATDNDIQGKEAGATFEGTTWLERVGSPTLTIVDNAGVKAISVTNRGSDWHCIDLKNLASLPDGFKYTVKVTGSTVSGAKMKLAQPSSPYGTHVSHVVGEDGAFSLEKAFTYEQLQADKKIRIQSEGTTGNFTIFNIVITSIPVSGGIPTPDGATIDDINITFSNADKALWEAAFSVSNTTNAAIEWVTDFGKDDSYSLKGTHLPGSSDYTGGFNAIRLTFAEPLAKNAVYTISYSVFVPAEGNEGKDTLTGPGIVLSDDYGGSTGVTKFPADFGTIAIGIWKDVNVTTPAGGLNETLKSIDFRFVVNDEPKHPDVWYIDNISIKQQLIEAGDTEPDYKDYTPLKDVYKDYFMIGTTSGNHRMTGDKLDIIKYHFNAFTPENEMKPSSVQNVQGVFTYDALDQQFAKIPGINLIGHTLAWHSQSPTWMWGAPDPLPAVEAKANMDAHIESVMNKYGANLHSIDVANEVFADGKNYTDWRLNLRDTEGWYLALGPEWVEHAFLKAAEIVDANGWNCKLYYNDYNLDNPAKALAVFNMVSDINTRYAGTRPDNKPLIEGIGMQGHYNQDTVIANVDYSINLFSILPGVAISVTELDITYANTGSLTEQQAKSQAVKYAQLFELYKKNAAGPANEGKGRIERVTLWGTNDADSWRGASFPLLFDKNLRAKEAFKAVLDPAKYLSETEPPQEIPKARSFYGTPILGTNDAVWGKAAIINADKKPTNQTVNAGAAAVVKTLWDVGYFYVRAEVTDAILDKTSANAWEQDSVEVFFSETAHRNPSYTAGDGQYRVSFEGSESFKSSEMADGFSSWADITDAGYVVEMKIPFRVIQPKDDTTVSFDVQINDVSAGASTRLLTVWSDLQANGYNTTERWGTLTLTQPTNGVYVYAKSKGDGYSGANIILGNNTDVWPWSTAGTDGKVAFAPVKDATYRIAINYTAMGTNAIRVRWIKNETNGGYTTQDGNVVTSVSPYNTSLSPDNTPTWIPAYFNSGMANGGTYTLTAEIKLDGDAQPEGLIGNIAIRGGGGGNEFVINWLKVEKVGTGGNVMLVNWPAPAPSSEPEPVKPVTPPSQPDTGSQPSLFESSTPTGGVAPANVANKPVKGSVVGTPKEVMDNAEKAFKQNPGIIQTSPPITLAAPPATNRGLTPVSVPIPAGTRFTALVSPNADGSFTPVPTYIDENGTVYALIGEAKTLIPVTIDTAFSDVSERHWFAESAKSASELGIIFGYGDTTFRPDATVTNQQTVAMLMRTVGYNSDYANVLQTASTRGIHSASGLSNNDNTSRSAAAVLIKDILASLNVDVSLPVTERDRLLAPFNDMDGLSEEEKVAFAIALKYGILVGTYTGEDYSTMSPDMSLTRAQMATIAVRLVDFLTK